MLELLAAPGTGNADTYWVDASFIEALRPRQPVASPEG
jgi:hypothetical protein